MGHAKQSRLVFTPRSRCGAGISSPHPQFHCPVTISPPPRADCIAPSLSQSVTPCILPLLRCHRRGSLSAMPAPPELQISPIRLPFLSVPGLAAPLSPTLSPGEALVTTGSDISQEQ
ncbi:collagen alpha-1(III) chain-like [Platysternon megacephalum]|uniref:Collagen alpha-1(III) chain-like n=1 Tax=Platysternon megacephalum TaxID=55544 RepID=A0A4D9DT75_9SAUR|nr:collagen alpha-1(III) chain-like [Platysternon megacephalum]